MFFTGSEVTKKQRKCTEVSVWKTWHSWTMTGATSQVSVFTKHGLQVQRFRFLTRLFVILLMHSYLHFIWKSITISQVNHQCCEAISLQKQPMLVLFDSINDVGKLKFVTFAILILITKPNIYGIECIFIPQKVKMSPNFFVVIWLFVKYTLFS